MDFTFISGATGGIGKAFVKKCAEKGYRLFLTGRSNEKLLALKNEIKNDYNYSDLDISFYACDLSDANSRADMIKYIDDNDFKFERIINVAGVDTQKAVLEYTLDKLLFQLRVNAEATISLTFELLLRRSKEMEIITISSLSGASPMPYFALYSATKAMLTNFFTSLHYELKQQGVKVTVVLPGGVPTRPDIIEEIKSQGFWGRVSAKSPEFVAEKSLKKVRKNKLKFIPGFFNKFLNFMMSLAPKRIVLSFIARRWKSHSKDAF